MQQETSIAAMESVRLVAPCMRERMLGAFRVLGDHGATCDEMEVKFHMKHQTASARINELRKRGEIRDTGMRRKTRSGCKAIVWSI
jgi:hypothetical protein